MISAAILIFRSTPFSKSCISSPSDIILLFGLGLGAGLVEGQVSGDGSGPGLGCYLEGRR